MNEPLVSVIINCRNGEKTLPDALNCLRDQTFKNFEIILWDNNSQDKTGEIARASDLKPRYFRGQTPVSLGAARNLAIARARGDYVAFLDCDDLWRPEKLARQVELLEKNPRVGLACTDTEISDGSRVFSRSFKNSKPERGKKFAELLTGQWISMSSAIIRREALDKLTRDGGSEPGKWFDESLNVCEEADVFYRIAHDWEVDYVDEPLTTWRVHGANSTFEKFESFAAETEIILAKLRALYPDFDETYPELGPLLERRAAFQRAVALWRKGENAGARATIKPWLKKSLKHRLFWLATFFPGTLFRFASAVYFALPAAWRR